MGAVWWLAGFEVRRRWRSIVALALLVGLVGVIVVAAAAGARRSSTALARFNAYSHSADVEFIVDSPTAAQLDQFRRTAQVAEVARLQAYALNPDGARNLAIAAAVDSAMGHRIDRARLVAGRVANPAAADEINIGETLAAKLRLQVGSVLNASSFDPVQLARAREGGSDPGPPSGPHVRLKVVGIVRRPLDLGDRAANGGVLVLTPAFDRAYQQRIAIFADVLRVRTRNGATDLPAVTTAARRIFGQSPDFDVQSLAIETQGAGDAIHVLTLALWIFAAVAALAGAVAIAIVTTREVSRDNLDQETLRGLGLTRVQRVAAFGPYAILVAAGGALLTAIGAIAASPLFPLGVAGTAEPDPGVHADAFVLPLGIAAVAVVVLLVALRAAIRITRPNAPTEQRRRRRPVSEAAAAAGAPPTVSIGLDMALRSGKGPTAVPVRSAFIGTVLGVLGVTAVFVFGASVQHLTVTPHLYGWTWDLTTIDQTVAVPCGGNDVGLRHVPGVGAVAEVCYEHLQVDGRPTAGWSIAPLRGSIGPAIVNGRTPRTPNEVALGELTLRALHKHLGDTIQAAASPTTKHEYRIVGSAVFPTLSNDQPLADGAVFTRPGLDPLLDPHQASSYLAARYAPGTSKAQVDRRVAAVPQFVVGPENFFGGDIAIQRPATPVEINRLRQIDWYPIIIAALLATLAIIAVGYTLSTSVRRRRKDLALLRTLGFTHRQVRATIASHATTVATIGLAIGIPAGWLIGTYVWQLVANGLGVATTATVPAMAIALTIPATIAIANLTAYGPARAAARTQPATELRSQ
jgi:hypothetical protein